MLEIKLDIASFVQLETDRLKAKADILLERAAADLTAMTYNHIAEEASSKLHSTRDQYLSELNYQQESQNIWTINLGQKAMWIEEGMPRHEMVDDLLKNGRYSKSGTKYAIIPFTIKGASQTSPAAMPIRQAALKAIRKAGINMKEIEREVDGRAKTGALHKLNVTGSPLKTTHGPHQGHGPVGQVRQGQTGTPFLAGLQVRQNMIQRGAAGMVQKTAMSFRVVSSLHKGTGKWIHPGIKAVKLLDSAYEWAMKEWTNTIQPEIIEALQAKQTV